jgi:hypothetical protein
MSCSPVAPTLFTRASAVRISPIVVFHLMLLTSAAGAQDAVPAAHDADSTAGPTVIGRWVLDSTLLRKNRRQTYVAAIAASDTIAGSFRTTRPMLKIYCHDNVRQVGLEVWVGQQIHGSLPGLTSGSHVGYTDLRTQRDSLPEQKAKWLYDLDKQVMGPDGKGRAKTIEELRAGGQYRVGVMLYKIGRRYTTFDLTDAGERVAWVADHCGAKTGER